MRPIQKIILGLIRTGMTLAVLGALPIEVSYLAREFLRAPLVGCSGVVDRQSAPRQTSVPIQSRGSAHRGHRPSGTNDRPVAAVF